MNARRSTRRISLRAMILCGSAAALTIGLPAAAWAATPAIRAAQQPATAITCNEVNPDLPILSARDCDSSTWGPLSGFVVRDRSGSGAFQCATGWAEGSLWINGQDCQPVSS